MSLQPTAVSDFPEEEEEKNKCVSLLYVSWKVITCIFSHVILVSLVVSYCILGAFTFEHLESANEKQVREGIKYIRGNITEEIWRITINSSVLHERNWTRDAVKILNAFENNILKEIKENGWDGKEEDEVVQWTWAGALFYSIIVITTIGYGHIAPKTNVGKITTIFYAIVGIPLMLLCLSNIGDVMASSFRFLYWRVCCYACTREPSKPLDRGSSRMKSRQPSVRSNRASQRYAGPYRPPINTLQQSFSETYCSKYGMKTDMHLQHMHKMDEADDFGYNAHGRMNPQSKDRTRHTVERERMYDRVSNGEKIKYPVSGLVLNTYNASNKKDEPMVTNSNDPVFCNRYALDKMNNYIDKQYQNRCRSLPHDPEGRRVFSPSEFNETCMHHTLPEKRYVKKEKLAPTARIMSPMGFAVHRQAKHYAQAIETSMNDEEWEDWNKTGNLPSSVIRPVPIWLCVFLVISYILGGAYLFSKWESWSFLDSAYFCFITLTTIGFGDFVPAQNVKEDPEKSIALCSLYLLFGIALLAMSFNLVQEEVIINVKSIARRLGILKEDLNNDS